MLRARQREREKESAPPPRGAAPAARARAGAGRPQLLCTCRRPASLAACRETVSAPPSKSVLIVCYSFSPLPHPPCAPRAALPTKKTRSLQDLYTHTHLHLRIPPALIPQLPTPPHTARSLLEACHAARARVAARPARKPPTPTQKALHNAPFIPFERTDPLLLHSAPPPRSRLPPTPQASVPPGNPFAPPSSLGQTTIKSHASPQAPAHLLARPRRAPPTPPAIAPAAAERFLFLPPRPSLSLSSSPLGPSPPSTRAHARRGPRARGLIGRPTKQTKRRGFLPCAPFFSQHPPPRSARARGSVGLSFLLSLFSRS